MRYINKLQEENDTLRGDVEYYRKSLKELSAYCQSDKFLSPGPLHKLVNTSDIISRINEILIRY